MRNTVDFSNRPLRKMKDICSVHVSSKIRYIIILWYHRKYVQSKKDVMYSLSRAWDKEKSEFPTGIKLITSRTSVRRFNH